MNVEMQRPVLLEHVIDVLKVREHFGIPFCVYMKTYVDKLLPNQECWLDSPPDGDENDDDVYPDFVVKNKLEFVYKGDQFEDVVMNVLHQKPTATIVDFIDALNYYRQNDTFLDF
jgi:hypothetical protein